MEFVDNHFFYSGNPLKKLYSYRMFRPSRRYMMEQALLFAVGLAAGLLGGLLGIGGGLVTIPSFLFLFILVSFPLSSFLFFPFPSLLFSSLLLFSSSLLFYFPLLSPLLYSLLLYPLFFSSKS